MGKARPANADRACPRGHPLRSSAPAWARRLRRLCPPYTRHTHRPSPISTRIPPVMPAPEQASSNHRRPSFAATVASTFADKPGRDEKSALLFNPTTVILRLDRRTALKRANAKCRVGKARPANAGRACPRGHPLRSSAPTWARRLRRLFPPYIRYTRRPSTISTRTPTVMPAPERASSNHRRTSLAQRWRPPSRTSPAMIEKSVLPFNPTTVILRLDGRTALKRASARTDLPAPDVSASGKGSSGQAGG